MSNSLSASKIPSEKRVAVKKFESGVIMKQSWAPTTHSFEWGENGQFLLSGSLAQLGCCVAFPLHNLITGKNRAASNLLIQCDAGMLPIKSAYCLV